MMDRAVSRGTVVGIMALDAITTIIGLAVWLAPFALGYHPATREFYPGGYDTMLHVTFGALIATLGAFRVMLAYRSHWIEIVLFVLGLFVLLLPTWLHMRWDATYNTAHLVGGAVVMVVAVISGLMSVIENRRNPAY
jgi:hypothetical protein